MSSNAPADTSAIVIRPSRGLLWVHWKELWEYRQLIYFLIWRDIKVRYKQTVVGVAWAVLQPLIMMIVFTIFFGILAKVSSEGVPYPVFAYVGLLPWQVFSRSFTDASNSLLKDHRLVTRTYFPRLILPISSVAAAMVDFAVAAVLLAGLLLYYGIGLSWTLVWLLALLPMMIATALGIGFWLSALNVEYRDVAYLMPFLNQFLLFATPVVYPSSLVGSGWRLVYALNPMVGVIDGFRWALFGVGTGPSPLLLLSAILSVVLFLTGAIFFRSRERAFADIMGSGD